MRALLLRYEDDGTRCFGLLSVGPSFLCHTIERPWLDNTPFTSCISDGKYTLTPHQSPTFGKCLKVKGCEPDRTDILVHPCNLVEQVTGCIGPGSRRGLLRDEPAVLNSRATMKRLLEVVTEPIPLVVRHAQG